MENTKTNFTYKSKDGSIIHAYKWGQKTPKTKAIIQISHGMAEHAGRYDEFAKTMVNENFILYGNDHRGHGKNILDLRDLGYLGKTDGFINLVRDMVSLTDIIKEENDGLPIILLGHSMGSFAAQRYIMDYPNKIQGLILSGSNGSQGFILKFGKFLAKIEKTLRGDKAKSQILNKLSFGSYNKNFAPNRTEFDWLSRNEKSVDRYINDSYCGTVFPASFYYEFFDTLEYIENSNNFGKISKDLPILIISGADDPVGGFGKGVQNLYKRYESIGIEKLDYNLYDGVRHEPLNEINRDEIISDIIQWANKII